MEYRLPIAAENDKIIPIKYRPKKERQIFRDQGSWVWLVGSKIRLHSDEPGIVNITCSKNSSPFTIKQLQKEYKYFFKTETEKNRNFYTY